MVSRKCDRKYSITRKAAACCVALLWASGYSSTATAESINSDWRLTPGITLTGISTYQRQSGLSTDFTTLAIQAEFTFKSDTRRYYTSLFVDYRISSDTGHTDNINLGGYLNYNWRRWDATSYLWTSKSPGGEYIWLSAGRLRYRLLENHKFGIEAVAAIDHPKSPEIVLGYYGTISESLTLNIFAGSGVNTGPDFATKIELAWTVH